METIKSRHRQAIYLVHGAVAWMIVTVVTFPFTVTHPLDCLRHPSKALFVYVLMALVMGQLLGTVIYGALGIAGHFPTLRWLHFLLPLIAAGWIGSVHVVFASLPALVPDGSSLSLSPMSLRLSVMILAALGVTPVIIVRSTRMSVRSGLRPEIRAKADPRWRT